MMHLTRFILTASLSFFISGLCFAEPENISLLKQEVIKYHDSGQYEHDIEQQINVARRYVKEQALLNHKQKEPKHLALVLDIDETSLSNYSNIIKNDFAANLIEIQKSVMRANAPAIKPMLALYQEAQKEGIKVFFVTGRKEFERSATQKNLLRAGYTHWAGLYLRPSDYHAPSIIPFKSNTRAAIEKKGYTIVATIGDQYSDIKGGHAQKGFKLPNPFYYLP